MTWLMGIDLYSTHHNQMFVHIISTLACQTLEKMEWEKKYFPTPEVKFLKVESQQIFKETKTWQHCHFIVVHQEHQKMKYVLFSILTTQQANSNGNISIVEVILQADNVLDPSVMLETSRLLQVAIPHLTKACLFAHRLLSNCLWQTMRQAAILPTSSSKKEVCMKLKVLKHEKLIFN